MRIRQLTSLQVTCEAALLEALSRTGLELLERRLDGIEETYVTARISGTSLEVFLYDDEAQTHGDGVSLYFETPDYRSPEALVAEFVRLSVAAARAAAR
jgi:hypothetical protein